MADPKPYNVAFWISTEIQELSFISLRTALEGALKVHLPAWSDEQIAERAEGLENDVFHQLGIIADQLRRDGVEPSFALEGEPGTAYIKAQNIEAVVVLAQLRKLPPGEFEQFCADLLAGLGATTRKVGGTGDGGVDFIATDLPVSTHEIAALRACYPIIIGQAKRYKEDNLVSVTEIRAFLGAAVVRSDDIKREDSRFGIYSPVAYAFWTTSDFNLPARKFAYRSGLWCLNGLSLAQLALRLGLPIARAA